MREFEKKNPYELDFNAFRTIGKDWLMICCDDEKQGHGNIMTASWGNLGILWNKPVCTLYVRPQRHTHKLIENSERFSACVLPEEKRSEMRFCGTKSGRDYNKFEMTGLTEIEMDGAVAIEESSMIFVLKKLYSDELKNECFNDSAPLAEYPADDFHTFYICEIEGIYIAKQDS